MLKVTLFQVVDAFQNSLVLLYHQILTSNFILNNSVFVDAIEQCCITNLPKCSKTVCSDFIKIHRLKYVTQLGNRLSVIHPGGKCNQIFYLFRVEFQPKFYESFAPTPLINHNNSITVMPKSGVMNDIKAQDKNMAQSLWHVQFQFSRRAGIKQHKQHISTELSFSNRKW